MSEWYVCNDKDKRNSTYFNSIQFMFDIPQNFELEKLPSAKYSANPEFICVIYNIFLDFIIGIDYVLHTKIA